jgi:hypothetical protein
MRNWRLRTAVPSSTATAAKPADQNQSTTPATLGSAALCTARPARQSATTRAGRRAYAVALNSVTSIARNAAVDSGAPQRSEAAATEPMMAIADAVGRRRRQASGRVKSTACASPAGHGPGHAARPW